MINGKTTIISFNVLGRTSLGEMIQNVGEDAANGFNRGFGHVRSWRVPPNWAMTDWHDEICAMSIMSMWQAMHDFDPERGIPLSGFVSCRIKAHALTRYRQEWRYALRLVPIETEILEKLSGADIDPHPERTKFYTLHRALKNLRPNEYWLLDQLFLKQRTETSIAAELNISQPAVNKRKRVALQRLRSIL